MSLLVVERVGGLAGFGTPGARVRSRGEIEFDSLSEADQRAVDALFKGPRNRKKNALRDGFIYRISRGSGSDTETIDVPEDTVPAAVAACVKDELV